MKFILAHFWVNTKESRFSNNRQKWVWNLAIFTSDNRDNLVR